MHSPYRVKMATQYFENVLDLRWTYEGVDQSLYGNGGPECATFIPLWQKFCETLVFVSLALFEIWIAYPRLKLPPKIPDTDLKGDRTGRKVMLMIMCITFGIEIGFKCATRQVIWILNPCHVITMVQIFLLVAPPKRYTTAVFRVSMHCLSGATVALLFPVVHTRKFPFESETYFIQHFLMLVTPFYLLRLGGAYTPEPLGDVWWDLLSCGILFLYHFIVLQPLGMLIHINLNNMQCPAPSDPFFGRGYRTAAVFHQHIVVLLHGKFYTWAASYFLPRRRYPHEHGVEESSALEMRDDCLGCNGGDRRIKTSENCNVGNGQEISETCRKVSGGDCRISGGGVGENYRFANGNNQVAGGNCRVNNTQNCKIPGKHSSKTDGNDNVNAGNAVENGNVSAGSTVETQVREAKSRESDAVKDQCSRQMGLSNGHVVNGDSPLTTCEKGNAILLSHKNATTIFSENQNLKSHEEEGMRQRNAQWCSNRSSIGGKAEVVENGQIPNKSLMNGHAKLL